jgi:hypothetical protein
MALDEDQFRAGSHGWQPIGDLLDVARLIAARTNHGYGWSGAVVVQAHGTGGYPIGQRKPADERQRRQKAVDRRGNQRNALGKQDMRPALHDFEIGERQQRLPQQAVPVYDDSCLSVRDGPKTLKYQTNIIEKANQVREDNVIEFLARKVQVLGRHRMEFEVRVSGPCQTDHFARDIDTDAVTRFRSRQQVARAAPDF